VTLAPLLFALAMWFVGTAAVVWLDSRPPSTFRASFRTAGAVAGAAMVAIWATRQDPDAGGAYVAFAAAILVWGWHEMGFLMGFVAGPRRLPCPPGVHGWARFRLATATVIHHEIALAAQLGLLVALTWGAPNQAAPLAFGVLFAARLSAKLNLFWGVPNLSDEVFPAHLAYLKSYFRVRAANPLFPVSIVAGSVAAWGGWTIANASTGGAAVAATLATALIVLAVVEHLFLVLPLRDGAMWRWASNTPVAVAPAAAD
jgi:putative photosynthetic complex assembly protein 2